MSSIRDKIPAYSTWEVFYDTVQILEQERSETTIKNLAEIVNSESLVNIIIYSPSADNTLSQETHRELIQRYKAFSFWLLGRFFRLLIYEELSNVHNIVVEAQLKILHLISISQYYIYDELSSEYSKVLKFLIKNTSESFTIEAFEPRNFEDLSEKMILNGIKIKINSKSDSERLKQKLLIFLHQRIVNKINDSSFKSDLYDDLDSLIEMLEVDEWNVKVNVIENVRSILENILVTFESLDDKVISKFKLIFGLIRECCFQVYTKKIELIDQLLWKFEDLLILILNQKDFFKTKIKIPKLIINSYENNSDFPKKSNKELIKTCYNLLNTVKKSFVYVEDLNIENPTVFIERLYRNLHIEISEYTKCNAEDNEIKINIKEISKTWERSLDSLNFKLNQINCMNGNCTLKSNLEFVSNLSSMLFKLKFEISQKTKTFINTEFFKPSFFLTLISSVNQHITSCRVSYPYKEFTDIIRTLPTLSATVNLHIFFTIITYQFSTLFYRTTNDLPVHLLGDVDKNESKSNLSRFYNNLAYHEVSKDDALKELIYFVQICSTGLISMSDLIKTKLQQDVLKIVNEIISKGSSKQQNLIGKNICDLIVFLENSQFVQKIILRQSQFFLLNSIPDLICVLYGDYVKIINFNSFQNVIESEFFCLNCNDYTHESIREAVISSKKENDIYLIHYGNKREENEIDQKKLIEILMNIGKPSKAIIKTVPCLAKHVDEFINLNYTSKWIQFVKEINPMVIEEYPYMVYRTLKAIQLNVNVPIDMKNKINVFCMEELFKHMKDSMQKDKSDLQYVIIETINWTSDLRIKSIAWISIKILLYFIVMPTSKHQELAAVYLSEFADKHQFGTSVLYKKFRREISETLSDLCAINQALANYNLTQSLDNVSTVLDFFDAKDFLSKEIGYAIPFLVALIVPMPDVAQLVREAAKLIEINLKELLANYYGRIFVYTFLNKDEETFKKCMTYVEATTKMSGSALRKRNFRTILNELLLRFSDKNDRVLRALILLITEDTDGEDVTIAHIPDYLQPRFLGVLLYFDTKLFSNEQVLPSLGNLLELMGPKRIVPFRLKIIAMLRTALGLHHGDYPKVNCSIWETFVRSCDLESLGPQLGTIFVSLLPLMQSYPEKIEKIFRYLIVENESILKDYIQDLFFLLRFDFEIDFKIKSVIKQHSRKLLNGNFNDQVTILMKYLTHDTVEIKIYALNYLKDLIETNRKQLDCLILGYNGIDSSIVELLEILMAGCKEKNSKVRSACGECIGQLGAIEPSHLPRKYTEAESFIFYMTEDAFVSNSLTELIKALQGERDTTVMDSFALAIQEMLRKYDISPESSSSKHNLWNELPQAHQQLIVPYLSSRYRVGQDFEAVSSSPIYGSEYGNTFQSWLFNWSLSMISVLPEEKRRLLEGCLPCFKQDEKILLHFLPHVLLHCLLEGEPALRKTWKDEFLVVIDTTDPDVTETQKRCVKVIFVLLDFLDRWLREFRWQNGASCKDDPNYNAIEDWTRDFCKSQLAKCSFLSGEYSRTLMYLEDYIVEGGEHDLLFLSRIYARLDEPDAISGVIALTKREPPLEQRILSLEVSGKLSEAAACYEQIRRPLKFEHVRGLTRCYLDLDNVNTALNFIRGSIETQPEYETRFLELEAEPLFRLGMWEELEGLTQRPELKNSENWGLDVGRGFLMIRKGDRDLFNHLINNLRFRQVEDLAATSLEEGAYRHGYSSIVNLHILSELEEIEKTIHKILIKPNDHNAVENTISKLASDLELRLKVVQESVKIIEPILCLRRVALNQMKEFLEGRKVVKASSLIDGLLGESWLRSARLARNSGIHQQAYTYLIKAEEFAPSKLFIEKAQLYWLKREHEQALTTLRRGIEVIDNDVTKIKIRAEAKLLIASYNDTISNVDREMNIKDYKEALELNKECEKTYVCLAQYYDRIFRSFPEADQDNCASDIQIHMINYFGKSLLYGTDHIYQSMPRMLSIWFDYGTRLSNFKERNASSVLDSRRQSLLQMTKLIDSFLERMPAYVFLTAFSQIVSRICHPQKEVALELKNIIVKLILQYPQQTLWMMMSVIKSSYAGRSKRCSEILGDSRLKNSSVIRLIRDFGKLAEKLIELCNKEIPDKVTKCSVNNLLRALPRLLGDKDFSEIMIPTQKFRKLVLPNLDLTNSQHNPFPNRYAHIIGIEDNMVILNSLQHPRKIVFRGSDGKRYVQMLKPKDDLRKDFRLMEFNDVVNQLLSRDPESRHRRLNIRLYSVVPLNEECGLIEWIHDLVGLRLILINIYKQRGQYMTGTELKDVYCNIKDPLAKKRAIFETKLLPRHPPVLGDWFRKTFPDAQSWLTARTAYIRTTAVMSSVGYILGLGDRHGENILLDSTCGDVVHVDFNCLFNKGETFPWPERVPFRLTRNMVSAMGPLGVEGVFRRSCACALKVVREHKDTLMSIVTPFVYDPLVSWTPNVSASLELTDKEAVVNVKNIESRLKGIVRTRGRTLSIPLSVEGQSNIIIQEAMNVDNLCQMFVGWGAYL